MSKGEDALPAVVKSFDAKTLDKISDSLESTKNITKADYTESLKILDAAGKKADAGKSLLSTLNSVNARRVTDLADHFNDIASIEDLYCKLKSLPINYEDIHKIDSAVVMKLNSLVSDAVNAGNTQKLRNPDLWLRFATHNDSASTCVLGRYYPDNISMCYDDIAKTNGLSYFELCCYDRLNNALGNDLMWEINEAYLDIQISKGKKFLLNCDPYDLDNLFRDGIYDNAHLRSFGKEINYLRDKGYTFKIDPQKTGFYIAEKTK